MLKQIDVLLVDLQDAGTRVYTFSTTLSYCMEAAKTRGIKVVILDRPNPVNGVTLEGNCLSPECASFVGRYAIPMRHGLTLGELARLFNRTYGIDCDLDIIPMKGWKRVMYFKDTGLPWVAPSPNLPTPVSTMVYPGQVIWEGTNVSEGRGTTQPFEIFGAPFIDHGSFAAVLDPADLVGCLLRPVAFEPTSNKFRGELCRGFHLQVLDQTIFRPYRTSLALLRAVLELHGESGFAYKQPPYEYEHEKLPIDILAGSDRLRRQVEEGAPLAEIVDSWRDDERAFAEVRKPFLLY